jgi:acetyl esterase/lipase
MRRLRIATPARPLVALALQTFCVRKAFLPAPLHAEDLDSVLPALVHGAPFDSSIHSGRLLPRKLRLVWATVRTQRVPNVSQ